MIWPISSASSRRARASAVGDAVDQLCWPSEVMDIPKLHFQRPENCIVVEPMLLLLTELLIRGSQSRTTATFEAPPSGFDQPMFEGRDCFIIDDCRRKGLVRAIGRV